MGDKIDDARLTAVVDRLKEKGIHFGFLFSFQMKRLFLTSACKSDFKDLKVTIFAYAIMLIFLLQLSGPYFDRRKVGKCHKFILVS